MSQEKHQGDKPWMWVLAVSLLLLVGLPILGLVVSWQRLGTRDDRAVGHWSTLGSPAKMPVAFEDAGLDLVYVRGQDGSLFECDHTVDLEAGTCWRKVKQAREIEHAVSLGMTYHGTKPAPPGPVVESLDLVGHRYRESSTYVSFALLEDGTIWVWKHYANPVSSFLFPLLSGPVCGLALALVLLAVIWIVVGVRALVRRRQARG
jgi:hypothetical protein